MTPAARQHLCSSGGATPQHRVGRRRTAVVAAAARAQPGESAGEVVTWAQQQFAQEIAPAWRDAINLTKVCLLLALEEEAAGQLEAAAPAAAARTGATASTWSLSRLDALAAEVADLLASEADEQPAPGQQQQPPSQQQASASAPAAAAAAAAAALAAARAAAAAYPMQVLGAVNRVLFARHGYCACNRWGDSEDSQLAAVLEGGLGTCAALCVLYLEVCRRLGLHLHFKVLDEGRYVLAWPVAAQTPQQPELQPAGRQQQQPEEEQQQQQQPEEEQQQQQPHPRPLLSVAGEACVVDVYGEGALLTVSEASELFGVTEAQLLAGSSRRELLCSLLTEQVNAHWAAAVGCSAAPACMTPLTARTVASGAILQLRGDRIARAAAAADKRLALLLAGGTGPGGGGPPGPTGSSSSSSSRAAAAAHAAAVQAAQLELGLLCLLSGRYEDAYLELGGYLERVRGHSAAARSTGGASAQQQQQQQQLERQPPGGHMPTAAGEALQQQQQTQSGDGGTLAASVGPADSVDDSAAGGEVSELHAAVQSLTLGGAAVAPPPASASSSTSSPPATGAAEAALASADEDDEASRERRRQQLELDAATLLFQRLQLELALAADRARGGA